VKPIPFYGNFRRGFPFIISFQFLKNQRFFTISKTIIFLDIATLLLYNIYKVGTMKTMIKTLEKYLGKNAIINILRSYPELAKEWIEDEELSKLKGKGHTYFEDTTYKQLLNYAENDLFKGQDLSDLNPAFNCSCTN
jgi:hypothetical protein